MKTERKIEVLARLDGWHKDGTLGNIQRWKRGTATLIGNIGYLTSYDAIIPLVVKWCNEEPLTRWCSFANKLGLDCMPNSTACGVVNYLFEQTPEQLCDALIKAAGEWEEE